MSKWRVQGENRLEGSLTVQGAKNAVLPILAATILTGCETELTNCPDLRDVEASLNILRYLGCKVDREEDVIQVDSRSITACGVPHDLMREMRSSVIFLGAILGRCGEASLSMPGGCELGPRPIDLHVEAMRNLGAEVSEESGDIICHAQRLAGGYIHLALPSVGATENAMIAACAAEGETTIMNAAREPEIEDLQDFLQALGADVSGAGTMEIHVRGFAPKTHVGHRVMPDRIAASTVLCACAAAGGDIELQGVIPEHFATVTDALQDMGCRAIVTSRSVRLIADGRLQAGRPIITRPYPGFATDAQPLMMAACLKARGTTIFAENIFRSRFRQADELKRLGANIRTEGSVAVVTGVERLIGAPVVSEDLRGGASLVIAGLSAQGETVVTDPGHIERGYEHFDASLRKLGAQIEASES